jgi:hypothetical protein
MQKLLQSGESMSECYPYREGDHDGCTGKDCECDCREPTGEDVDD